LATFLLLSSFHYYFYYYHETALRSQVILGILLSLTVLARLDAIFIASLLFFSRFVQIEKSYSSLGALFFMGCVFSLPILTYMTFNFFHTSHVMPISGVLKSSFPNITMTNLPLQPSYLIRVAPPAISSLVITAVLAYQFLFRNQVRSAFWVDIFFINIGVLFFCSYEFLFQKDAMWGLRPWHFALPNAVMLVSLGISVLHNLPRKLSVVVIPLLVMFNLFAANQKFLTSTPANPIKSDLYETANWIRQHTKPDDVLAITDPGVIAFFGGRKTISLDGLVNNYDYQKIVNNQNLQEYLNENKVSYIGIFGGHDATLPFNKIRIKSRLFDSFDTLLLNQANVVYTSTNGFYTLWMNKSL